MKSAREGEHTAVAAAELAAGLIDSMLDAVWLVDARSLRVVAANTAAATLLGVTPAELRGRALRSLCATPEDELFWAGAASGLRETIESQSWLRRADGTVLPVTRRVSHLPAPGGDGLFVVVMHDRSAQCRIEGELESRVAELAATLESTADGILVTDGSGRVTTFNQKFLDIWGLPHDAVASGVHADLVR
ncbi:MAG TPA: PAS domain-containing protein, partial [Albitalea sp.]|nr:PAS domain-containing protein [Albitalea sp.]